MESSKAVGPWRERVALAAHAAMGGRPLFEGPVWVATSFVLPRPKSAPKTRAVSAAKRPDLDKLVRSVFDAITSVVVSDDAQVVASLAAKRVADVGETAGVTITLAVAS